MDRMDGTRNDMNVGVEEKASKQRNEMQRKGRD